MRNLFLKRFFVIVLCAMLVFTLACPAFASFEGTPTDEFVAISEGSGSEVFEFAIWQDLSYVLYVSGSTWPSLESFADCLDSAEEWSFSIERSSFTSSPCLYSNIGGLCGNSDTVYILGNPTLYSSEYDAPAFDNLPFAVVVFNDLPKPKSYLFLERSFFEDEVSCDEDGNPYPDEGYYIKWSVSPLKDRHFTADVVNDTGNVFTAAIGMVGTVASTVASYPILFLPIVIGLCGIGVAFFRRIKQ